MRGVPKGALRTHSAYQAPLWGDLVTCRVSFARAPELGPCLFVHVKRVRVHKEIGKRLARIRKWVECCGSSHSSSLRVFRQSRALTVIVKVERKREGWCDNTIKWESVSLELGKEWHVAAPRTSPPYASLGKAAL